MQTGGELTGASTAALPESDAESLVDVDHAAAKIWPEWPALPDSAQDVLKAAAVAVRETGETAQQVLRTVENAMLAEGKRAMLAVLGAPIPGVPHRDARHRSVHWEASQVPIGSAEVQLPPQ